MILYNTSIQEIVETTNKLLDEVQKRARKRTLSHVTEDDIAINDYWWIDGGGVSRSYKYHAETTVLGIATIETKRFGLCANVKVERTYAPNERNRKLVSPFTHVKELKKYGKNKLWYIVFEDRYKKAMELKRERAKKYEDKLKKALKSVFGSRILLLTSISEYQYERASLNVFFKFNYKNCETKYGEIKVKIGSCINEVLKDIKTIGYDMIRKAMRERSKNNVVVHCRHVERFIKCLIGNRFTVRKIIEYSDILKLSIFRVVFEIVDNEENVVKELFLYDYKDCKRFLHEIRKEVVNINENLCCNY